MVFCEKAETPIKTGPPNGDQRVVKLKRSHPDGLQSVLKMKPRELSGNSKPPRPLTDESLVANLSRLSAASKLGLPANLRSVARATGRGTFTIQPNPAASFVSNESKVSTSGRSVSLKVTLFCPLDLFFSFFSSHLLFTYVALISVRLTDGSLGFFYDSSLFASPATSIHAGAHTNKH